VATAPWLGAVLSVTPTATVHAVRQGNPVEACPFVITLHHTKIITHRESPLFFNSTRFTSTCNEFVAPPPKFFHPSFSPSIERCEHRACASFETCDDRCALFDRAVATVSQRERARRVCRNSALTSVSRPGVPLAV
jgi:hypothetical protein